MEIIGPVPPPPTSATREKEGLLCSLAEISTVPGTWLEVVGKSKGRVCWGWAHMLYFHLTSLVPLLQLSSRASLVLYAVGAGSSGGTPCLEIVGG